MSGPRVCREILKISRVLSVLCSCGKSVRQGRISTIFKLQVSALDACLVIDLDCQTFTNITDVLYRSPNDHCATTMQRGAEGKMLINTSTPAKRKCTIIF